jgi:ABC-type microcin C transport system duplicated ATPase subunit YejF
VSPTKPDVQPAAAGAPMAPTLLEVDDLQVHFALRGGMLQRLTGHDAGAVKAVDGV